MPQSLPTQRLYAQDADCGIHRGWMGHPVDHLVGQPPLATTQEKGELVLA